jgi:hypothetical protein
MAAKRLRWGGTKLGSFSDGRACLIAQFLDHEGNLLEWVPAWRHVQALFERAANAEVVNKPDSRWLAQFAETANHVFGALDALEEAYKLRGKLTRVRHGTLVVGSLDDWGNVVDESEVAPAFRIGQEFLNDWLDEHVTVLVINGFAVRLERRDRDDTICYPEPHEPGVAAEELPFE